MRWDKTTSSEQEFSKKIDNHPAIIISEKENQQWDITIKSRVQRKRKIATEKKKK